MEFWKGRLFCLNEAGSDQGEKPGYFFSLLLQVKHDSDFGYALGLDI